MRQFVGRSGAMIVALLVASGSAVAQTSSTTKKHGTLCVSSGCPMYDFELADLIASHIPACTKKLIVLTECYGGDVVNDFANSPNTAVISATSPGQLAQYGGYDDDAANALRPGPGRNGNDVHVAGRNGRGKGEKPMRGGTMSAGNFNLDDVSSNGPVRSRHIVYYAGIPGGTSAAHHDNTYRDTIRNNFAGQANTTVHTAGGRGAGSGYDQPGTTGGLHRAIDDAATEITNSPDPCREQFILFVSDHGDLEKLTQSQVRELRAGRTVKTALPGFVSGVDADPADFLSTAGNITSYSVLLPLGTVGMMWNMDQGRMLEPGQLVLTVSAGGYRSEINTFRELHSDFDSSGVIGDFSMDTILIEFDIPEDVFVTSFFDNDVTVALTNRSHLDLPLGLQGLHSGEMAKAEYKEPCLADYDANGEVEDADSEAYMQAFEMQDPDADLNGSGEVEAEDLALFLERFFSGC